MAESPTARLTRTDRSLLRLHGKRLIPVMVRFDVDPVASYGGGLSGFRATSPSMTGERIRQGLLNRVRSYQRYLSARIASIADSVPATSGNPPAPDVQGRLRRRLDAGSGGQHPWPPAGAGCRRRPAGPPGAHAHDHDPAFPGRPFDRVWPFLGGPRKAGRNVIVGVLDTGIWPEHPIVQGPRAAGAPAGPWACQFGDGSGAGPRRRVHRATKVSRRVHVHSTPNLRARWRSATASTATTAASNAPRETRTGHGTHTATTAAGSTALAHRCSARPRARQRDRAGGAR